ncbi:bifunctional Vacuolar sorting protein 39-Transforming growth factor beta receptor-associated domain 2/Vam6-VPS39-TRAP1 family/Citron homology (CNH) domain/Protein kinase-like domain superfamily [Babesia duncani]|uniref:Bifunctional Vacuolar sorting protein 39-Transforming growth factor beta receptor-associated domain 2/Vam6-VPS39-TRAP1 family/Citron homology (CNH) domain/Protein kinase-like domain superfamily n=1 Tax=Babesia duncani TaxID=323732 RepID=A0AAD9PLR9_9APIC|nr:bifunctional Vacuolar sorting protein 39-Transforming growth factor beta receptor-associated domain 2/Vam6-VPS39-TRAP1 family/Citron homology (CNH) domain/Protein kinase-like domain superfamily [Babesia duncani]
MEVIPFISTGKTDLTPFDDKGEMEILSHDVVAENNEYGHVNGDSNLDPNDDSVASPHVRYPELQGFAALKEKTFDNNFKDLEELKRKNELLALSKRSLYSKLYTPKLEVLQRLVEPGLSNNWDLGFIHSKSQIKPTTLRHLDTHFTISDSVDTFSKQSSIVSRLESPGTSGFEQNHEISKENFMHAHIPTEPTTTTENVITLVTSKSVVNGLKKKRIEIPIAAYRQIQKSDTGTTTQPRVILKVVEAEQKSFLNQLEKKLDTIVQSLQLCDGKIVNDSNIISQLESIRPSWMDKETFYLLCCKPSGMPIKEFLEAIQCEKVESFVDKVQRFNLVNTNAIGYVLDAEGDIIKEFGKLNRVHRKLINEKDIYNRIFEKMQVNFTNQIEDLLHTTRQDLRLAAGYSYLQWGRIKNITTFKFGDQVIREKGFSQEIASKTKIKTLQRMQEIIGGTNSCVEEPNEAQYMYYIKSLQDMEECEQEALTLQITRDRTQAISEYSAIGPPYKPDRCYPWRCIGVSCNSIVWKMFDTQACTPVVYKYRQIQPLGILRDELDNIYKQTMQEIKRLSESSSNYVIFSNKYEIREDCIVEPMTFIKYLPFSEFIENLIELSPSERFSQVQVLVRKICKVLNNINVDFILPLKSSRIYVHSGGVVLFAGIPSSLIGQRGLEILKSAARPTIASLLWGKNLEWYLPPECNGNPAHTRDPELVSKAHTWMIGKIVYEAICHGLNSRMPMDLANIDTCDDDITLEFIKICLEPDVSKRPNISQIMTLPYLKRIRLNYGTFGPMDVPKVQCAVEFLGDIETIVLNKIRKTEKGVADYECEKYETMLFDISEWAHLNSHILYCLIRMDIFKKSVILRWMESSKISAVSWCFNNLYLGTDTGELYSFGCDCITAPVNVEKYKLLAVAGKRIVSITSLEPREELLILNADGDVFAIKASLRLPPLLLCHGATCITRQASESINSKESIHKSPAAYTGSICIASPQKLSIYTANGQDILHQIDIDTTRTPTCITWVGNSIVFGCNSGYYATDSQGTVINELCVNETPQPASARTPILAAASGAMTCLCIDKDVLLLYQNTGIFYNMDTLNLSQKNTIQWSDRLEALGCCPPFIVGLTCQRSLEIYGIRNQRLYQTIEQKNVRSVCYMPDKGCMLMWTPNLIYSVKPISFYEHLHGVMKQAKLSEALQLVNLYFASDDGRKMHEMKASHTVAGWIKFTELNFPAAFQHFTFGTVDIVYLLQFWQFYGPVHVPDGYQYHSNLPRELLDFIPATENIREFIKNGEPDSNNWSKLMELANGSFATFLLSRILSENWHDNIETGALSNHIIVTIETTALLLLAELNDSRLNRLLQVPLNKSNIDLEVAKRHLSLIHKDEIYAKLLIRQGNFIQAMDIFSNVIKNSTGNLQDVNKYCLELAACINNVMQCYTLAQFNKNSNFGLVTSKDEIRDMLNTHLPLLFDHAPNAALDILCRNHAVIPISTEQVLKMICEHSKEKDTRINNKIKYLEDLVITHKVGSVLENTLLVRHYVKMHELIQNTNPLNPDTKMRLLNVLEGNYSFDLDELKEILSVLDCLEIQIILCSKLGQHEKALELCFTNEWKYPSITVCEAYCQCFGDCYNHDEFDMNSRFKRFFSNLQYWIDKASQVPIDTRTYCIDQNSATSIDKLIMALLKVLVLHADNIHMTRNLLSKYLPLSSTESSFNGLAVLELIPDDWNFAPFAQIFTRLQQKALHEQRTLSMQRGLTKSLYNKTRNQLSKITSIAPALVDATTTCATCLESIKIGMSLALAKPDSFTKAPIVMHEHCAQKYYINPNR